MNSDHLKYLIAVSKAKTMSDAAEKLFVTPQALSMALKKLEEELQMPLLSRSSTGTTLTENGQWLVKRSEAFFDDIERRQMEYHNYLHNDDIIPEGTVDLAVNNQGIGPTRLADMVCAISLRYPDFQINIREDARTAIEQAILAETVDLGCIYRTKVGDKFIDKLDDELVFYPLQTGRLVIQAAEWLSISKIKNPSLKKAAAYPFCSYDVTGENRVAGLLRLILGEEVTCINTNSFSVYQVGLESGKYIALSICMDGEIHCANYLSSVKNLFVRDDVVVYFGVIRKKSRVFSDNIAFLWNEIQKEYGGIISL